MEEAKLKKVFKKRGGDEFTKKIDKFVCDKILETRLKKGMTRKHLAEKLNLTNQQIAKYDLGRNRVSIGRLVTIARVLNEPVENFYKDCDIFNIPIEKTPNQLLYNKVLKNFMKIRKIEHQKLIDDMIVQFMRLK